MATLAQLQQAYEAAEKVRSRLDFPQARMLLYSSNGGQASENDAFTREAFSSAARMLTSELSEGYNQLANSFSEVEREFALVNEKPIRYGRHFALSFHELFLDMARVRLMQLAGWSRSGNVVISQVPLTFDAPVISKAVQARCTSRDGSGFLQVMTNLDLRQFESFLKREYFAARERLKSSIFSDSGAKVRGEGKSSSSVPQMVTLLQMAAIVSKSKDSLKSLKTAGILPPPTVKGGKGKADEWEYQIVRPLLEEKFNRRLPKQMPAFSHAERKLRESNPT